MNEEGVGSTGSVDTGPPVQIPTSCDLLEPSEVQFPHHKKWRREHYFTEVRTESNDKMFLKVFQKL